MTNRSTVVAAMFLVAGIVAFARAAEAAPAVEGSGPALSLLRASSDVPPPVSFAWRIAAGAWEGVALDGLTVAAIVPAGLATYQADTGAVITVDVRANALQRAALVSLARELSGGRISDIARVRPSIVRFGATQQYVEVRADDILRLTRSRAAEEPGTGR